MTAEKASVWKELLIIAGLVAVLAPLSRLVAFEEAEWPRRPIELVVFSGAGGGTDLANRVLASAMAGEVGAEIRVSNMTGGRGGVAAQYVHGGRHDGHRWMGVSETVLSLATRGGHHTTARDWHFFIFTGSPGVLSVPQHSPYRTFEDLQRAARERPNQLTIAASGRGSVWHLRTEMLREHAGLNLRFIPYEGSGAAQVAAISGEVDAVHTGLAEQLNLIEGGRLRPLVMTEPEAAEGERIGRIPALTEFLPGVAEHLMLPQWLGFTVPVDTPPEAVAAVDRAFHRAMNSDRVRDFLSVTRNRRYGLSGEPARAMAERLEKVVNWMMYDLGIVKQSPARFGIPRPAAENGLES
jgi:tripartite-type tricarboxylate transporter receptor subunit TctC